MAKTLVYELYPIAWENYGGLTAMKNYLEQIKKLEVDYVWVAPIYPSPRHDHGYDVADYTAIDPRFGTMADFDLFVRVAHDMGIKVLMDLVLNHTSTEHEWFKSCPEFYCWEEHDRPGWHNIFNNGSAWKYDDAVGKHYLHLFHEEQADLNWFPDGPDGDINWKLVKQFWDVIDFWMLGHGIDGFRLDAPQAINKDFSSKTLEMPDLLFGNQTAKVLNGIFGGTEAFLMMECVDPTFGELTEYYTGNTPVDFVMNVLLKDELTLGEFNIVEIAKRRFLDLMAKQVANPYFMLDLESHDSPRCLSRLSIPSGEMMEMIFGSGAQAICLYQGQELCLYNPSTSELPDELMLELDAQTAMRYGAGENLEDLRPLSRANARVPLPERFLKYRRWDEALATVYMRDWIKYWKQKS